MNESGATSPKTVEEFVGAAHGNIDRVRELLDEDSTMANATWDWGGGDWETALGAAAHTGRRDIAELLLAQGARVDVFAAAMLGQLDVVRAMLTVTPTALDHLGPHGISLADHAEAGGDEAAPVVAYLASLAGG
jgi:hypothetical protein